MVVVVVVAVVVVAAAAAAAGAGAAGAGAAGAGAAGAAGAGAVVVLGFRTLLTSQVISVAFYSEPESPTNFAMRL